MEVTERCLNMPTDEQAHDKAVELLKTPITEDEIYEVLQDLQLRSRQGCRDKIAVLANKVAGDESKNIYIGTSERLLGGLLYGLIKESRRQTFLGRVIKKM